MKKLFLASALAVALLAFGPLGSKVSANPPQACGPYGWLACKALRVCPHIHSHGPLYNYGPYYGGPGYQNMNVTSLHGGYVPAYPTAYYYGAGAGYGYPPQYGYANPGMAYPQPPLDYQQARTAPAQAAPAVSPVQSTTNSAPVPARFQR